MDRYNQFMAKIVEKVEKDDLQIISINCQFGKHRSVALGNLLKDRYYFNAKVIHLEINKIY